MNRNNKGTYISCSGCGILVQKSETFVNKKTNLPQIYFKLALVSDYSDDVVAYDCMVYGKSLCTTIDKLAIGSKVTFVAVGGVRYSEYHGNKTTKILWSVKQIPDFVLGSGNSEIDLEHRCVIDKGNANYKQSSSYKKNNNPSKASSDDDPF